MNDMQFNHVPILQCNNLHKTYQDDTSPVTVLKGVNLVINAGDRIAIVGPSGSGKSTLLHLLGGLDKPSSGQILLNDINWQDLSESRRCALRNKQLGFVYQFHHLLPEFTALENVALPLLMGKHSLQEAENKARDILSEVGLTNRLTHKPAQLSGGERQRVALARALVHQPQCVLADEPTGNLDHSTALLVFELMLSLNQHLQTALVIVTHDMQLAHKMQKVLTIQDGFVQLVSVDQGGVA